MFGSKSLGNEEDEDIGNFTSKSVGGIANLKVNKINLNIFFSFHNHFSQACCYWKRCGWQNMSSDFVRIIYF